MARVAEQRLRAEFSAGNPAAAEIPAAISEHWKQQFDRIVELDPAGQAGLAGEVAKDIEDRPSQATLAHGMYSPGLGRKPSGAAQVDALASEAEAAIRAFAKDQQAARRMLQHLRCDRKLLELFAARGRHMMAYAATKKRYGL